MARYENLSKTLCERIKEDRIKNKVNPFTFKDENAVRRKDNPHDYETVLRSNFIRDTDKIINCPFYNRYADKTQVFSLYKNDDITHRSLHVQLVSRIARTIGKALNLNTELIESIALGHDIGHTPFGHTGERLLDNLYRERTGKRFFHNVHSVRVLDKIFPLNVTLQTLDGILAHNGELELDEYRPSLLENFSDFDDKVLKCYTDGNFMKTLTPSTLEGCVVRISDIIAYLGKDRHDAEKSKIKLEQTFSDDGIGVINAEIVNNLIVNVIENSYDKPYIKMDDVHFSALKKAKSDNYQIIYNNKTNKELDQILQTTFERIYAKLLDDLKDKNYNSPVFTHHINYLNKPYYKRPTPYDKTDADDIIIDYIASMTDDYFIELYEHLFPSEPHGLKYKGYFD